jgi:hypothetical protein
MARFFRFGRGKEEKIRQMEGEDFEKALLTLKASIEGLGKKLNKREKLVKSYYRRLDKWTK